MADRSFAAKLAGRHLTAMSLELLGLLLLAGLLHAARAWLWRGRDR